MRGRYAARVARCMVRVAKRRVERMVGTLVRLTRGVGANLIICPAVLGGERLEEVLLAVDASVVVLSTGRQC